MSKQTFMCDFYQIMAAITHREKQLISQRTHLAHCIICLTLNCFILCSQLFLEPNLVPHRERGFVVFCYIPDA